MGMFTFITAIMAVIVLISIVLLIVRDWIVYSAKISYYEARFKENLENSNIVKMDGLFKMMAYSGEN